MIFRLNPRHGVEVWINQAMAIEIEAAIREMTGWSEVYYCYTADAGPNKPHSDLKTKWFGKGLIPFICKAQMRAPKTSALYATHFKNKAAFERIADDMDSHDYNWLGDAGPDGYMICCDQLFGALWDRIKEQATRGAETRRLERHLGEK